MALKQSEVFPIDFITRTADYARSAYQLTINAEKWSYEAVLNPEVWKNQGDKLHPGDLVTILASDGSYDCDLRVIASDRGYTLMRPIRTWFAPQAEAAAAGEPRVGFAPGIGFVAYNEKGEALSKHPSQDDADAALKAYLETREAA